MTDLFNDIGAINPGFTDFIEDRDSIDYLKDVRTQLRETMLKNYEPNKLDGQTEFDAICLKHLNNLNTSNGDNIIRIKARIPVLHNMIPVPKDETDFRAISLYPTFIGVTKDFNPAPTPGSVIPGTRMMVTFDNMRNFAGPHIKSIFDITNVTAAGGGGGGGKGSGGIVLPGNITTTTGNLARYGDNKPKYYNGKGIHDPRNPYTKSKKTLAKVIRFVGFRRKGKMSPKGVVLHDGASSLKNTISTLCANGTGTHFIILRDGTILQTGELTQKLIHAGSFNKYYLGIDFIGKDIKPSINPGSKRTIEQLEAVWQLINFLAKEYKFPIAIGLTTKGNKITVPLGRSGYHQGSIHSHQEVGHADGDFAKLYMINRMYKKNPQKAFAHAKKQWMNGTTSDGKTKATHKTSKWQVTFTSSSTPVSKPGSVNWVKGKPKNTIPIGTVHRKADKAGPVVRGLGPLATQEPLIVEVNNYTGESYTEEQLQGVLNHEKRLKKSKQPDLTGIQ